MKKKQNLIISLVLLVIVILGIGGFYVYSQKSDSRSLAVKDVMTEQPFIGKWLSEKNHQVFTYSSPGNYDPVPSSEALNFSTYIEFNEEGKTCLDGEALIKKDGECRLYADYKVSDNIIIVDKNYEGPDTRYKWEMINDSKLQLTGESFYVQKNEWQPSSITTYTKVE